MCITNPNENLRLYNGSVVIVLCFVPLQTVFVVNSSIKHDSTILFCNKVVFIVLVLGFKGIWGSGLSISAQLGVRDSNEASWTQILDVLEFMSDASSLPILLDADTGYGNFNNARRLVRKLEERGVAGACLEDKLFPKTNSLLDGRAQPLADVKEFALKIKACKGDYNY